MSGFLVGVRFIGPIKGLAEGLAKGLAKGLDKSSPYTDGRECAPIGELAAY